MVKLVINPRKIDERKFTSNKIVGVFIFNYGRIIDMKDILNVQLYVDN